MENTQKNTSSVKGSFLSKLFLPLYILILGFTFFKVYTNVFDKKIHLGGDNAGYYILGQSIARGEGYTNIHTKEKVKHNHFPPGYPAIIAVVSKLFSDDIIFIKKVNGFFLFLSIALLFLIIHNVTGNLHIPFIVSLFTLINYHILSYSFIMMSEIPFLFFSLLCLWLILKVDFTLPIKKNWLFFLLIIFIAFSYYIRSSGLAILACIAALLVWKKNWKYLATLIGGFVVIVLPWFIRSKSLGGSSYVSQFLKKNPYRPELGEIELADLFNRIWINFERYVTREIPSGIFNLIEIANYKNPITSNEWIIGVCFVVVILFGLYRLKRFSEVIFLYLTASFGILLVWPDAWFGTRFLLPLIPILTFLFIYGVNDAVIWIAQKGLKLKNPTVIQISMVAITLLIIQSYSANPIGKLEQQAKSRYDNKYQNYFELAKWIKENTPDTSVTCCRKGELFYLYSHRYINVYKYTLDKEEQIEYLKSINVDYVVLEQLGYSSTGMYLYPAIERYPEKFKIIKHLKDPDTYLMKFLPELGYWGEFKENKRDGQGVYVWENGQKYNGEWKDNVRNGKGVLIFPNGQQIEGVWTNDVLNGEVITKSPEGEIIEKSIYKNNVKI